MAFGLLLFVPHLCLFVGSGAVTLDYGIFNVSSFICLEKYSLGAIKLAILWANSADKTLMIISFFFSRKIGFDMS